MTTFELVATVDLVEGAVDGAPTLACTHRAAGLARHLRVRGSVLAVDDPAGSHRVGVEVSFTSQVVATPGATMSFSVPLTDGGFEAVVNVSLADGRYDLTVTVGGAQVLATPVELWS